MVTKSPSFVLQQATLDICRAQGYMSLKSKHIGGGSGNGAAAFLYRNSPFLR